MTRDDVIRMAREAGLIQDWMILREEDEKNLARFAAIAKEQEREECARVCEQMYKDACADAIRARKETQ